MKKDKSIAASYLLPLLQYADAHQWLDTNALLAQISCPREKLESSKFYLSREQYIAVMEAILQHTDPCQLVSHLIETVQITQHGLLGLLVMCGINLRQTLKVVMRFYHLQTRLVNLEFIEQGNDAIIRIYSKGELQQAEVPTLELVLLTIANTKHQLLGAPYPRDRIDITGIKTADYARYSQQFAVEIHDKQPHYQLVFPREQLDIKLKSAHQPTYQLLTQQCEDLLLQLGDDDSMLIDKLQHLFRICDLPFPSLVQLADQLHTTPRTLTRRLKQAHSSYQRLIDHERITRTKTLLQQTDLSITDIASQLYFTDASHLTKLFKRYEGMTPSQFRE